MHSDFTPFMSKSFQIWDYFFPLLFPKDSKNLKSLDIGFGKVGAKNLFEQSEQIKKCVKKKILPRHFLTIFEPKCSNLISLISITVP